MNKMRAIVVKNFGAPKVLKLQEVKIPPISADEVLIKIKASGVNPVDTYIREGAFIHLPELPYTPGKDGSGVIDRVGSNVTHLKAGDRVFVCHKISSQYGTCADYSVAAADNVFPLRKGLSFEEGAAIGIPYFTAYRALVIKGQAACNDLVFIHGASGAVGLATLQVAKSRDIKVIATAGTDEGMKLVKECGADYVFNHRSRNYISEIDQLTKDKKIDAIIEMQADENLNKDLQLLGPNGRVMVVGCRGTVTINPRFMMAPETKIIGIALLNSTAAEWKTTADALLKGIEDGWVKPIIDKKYSLEECATAHYDIIHSKGAKGKLIIDLEKKS